MEKKISRLEELKDSRILYEKKLPRFGYCIIVIATLLLIVTAVWLGFARKTFVVKGGGIVESENKNYIMAPYSGEIKTLNIKEGANVSKGEVVAIIQSTEKELQNEQNYLQKKQLQNNIKNLERQIELNVKLSHSVQNNTNYFNNEPEERSFYNQYELYNNQRKQLSEDKKEGNMRKDELYHQTLSDVESRISEYKIEMSNTIAQLQAYKSMNNTVKLKALESGKIHIMDVYKKGMEVQAGAVIASISEQNEKYIVKAQISASDRVRIKMNDTVDMEINGLAQSLYGTIKGRIINIDTDVSQVQAGDNEQENSRYFNITILPEKDYLINKDGDVVNLTSGLEVEARIIYDKMSYLAYIAQALGIKAE